jgi:tRNA splicing ligase
MTKLIIESDDTWTREKIKFAIDVEIHLLKKASDKIQVKLNSFEKTYGPLDRDKLYGKMDDMILVEWEGEIESLRRVRRKLKSLEEINFEYR